MNLRATEARCRGGRGFGSSMMMAFTLFALAMVGIAWVYLGMVTRDRWPIRWLEIEGAFQRVSAERVRTRVESMVEGSFFTVELGAIRTQVESLPWVSAATVQKNWPDTVKISVREFQPVAHWTGGRMVSNEGLAFAVSGADEIQGLPWLAGPEGLLPKVFGQWLQFNEELYRVGLEIERIRLDPRGSWYLALGNGTEVFIGREDALPRLRRMVASWSELRKLNDLAPAGVDLRYSNGFAVRWPKPPPRLAANPD